MEGSYLICYALYNDGYLMMTSTLIYIVGVNLNSVEVGSYKLSLHNLLKLSLHVHT